MNLQCMQRLINCDAVTTYKVIQSSKPRANVTKSYNFVSQPVTEMAIAWITTHIPTAEGWKAYLAYLEEP